MYVQAVDFNKNVRLMKDENNRKLPPICQESNNKVNVKKSMRMQNNK